MHRDKPGRVVKRAFISHISEEAEVASILQKAISEDFLELVDVFVSAEDKSVGAGDDWFKAIDRALRQASLMMVLCSPESIRRPWVNFEAGAAWIRGVPFIPLCHAGLSVDDLPMPFSARQGILLTDADGLSRLYARIAGEIGSAAPQKPMMRLAKDLDAAGKRIRKLPGAKKTTKSAWRTSAADGALQAMQLVPSTHAVQHLECSLVLNDDDTAVLTRRYRGIQVHQAVADLHLPIKIGVNRGTISPLRFKQLSGKRRLSWTPLKVPGGGAQQAAGRVMVPGLLTPGTKDISFEVSTECIGGPSCRTESEAMAFYAEAFYKKEYSGMLITVPAGRLDVVVDFPKAEAGRVQEIEPVAFYGTSEEDNVDEYIRIERRVKFTRNGGRIALTVSKPLRGQVYGVAWMPPAG